MLTFGNMGSVMETGTSPAARVFPAPGDDVVREHHVLPGSSASGRLVPVRRACSVRSVPAGCPDDARAAVGEAFGLCGTDRRL